MTTTEPPKGPTVPEFTTTGNPTGPDIAPPETKGLLRGLPGGKRTPPKDTPPKANRRTNARTNTNGPKMSSAPAPEGAIAAGISQLYGQVGMFVGMFDQQCGTVIITNAAAMGASLEAAAKESPAMQEFLQRMITTSVWGQVLAAHAPVIMAIGMHHIPAIRSRVNPSAPEGADTQAPSNMKTGTVG